RATDFWNRYKEDVDLARKLGCRAFRLSLSWARLEPAADAWNAEAFAHYRDVLQYMRDAGMATVVTLHHNTWPVHVQAAGNGAGMLDAGFPDRMAAYAKEVASRLGDLIDYYVTLNEPNQLVYGYVKFWSMRNYAVPPGLEPFATGTDQMDALLRLIPNLFLAHARSRAAIRALRPDAPVGTNPLVLGLPRWLQHIIDGVATRLRTPDDVRRQAGRISQHRIVDSGEVDVSIAQITMTDRRMDRVLFSEPYAVAHFAVLHPTATAMPPNAKSWTGKIGVQYGTPASDCANRYFPAAHVQTFDAVGDAVRALEKHHVDLVFEDDLILQQYATDELHLSRMHGHDQPFAVAMALGSRALLNCVDIALRAYKRSHPGLPHGRNRKTIAHIGRESVTPTRAPDLDPSLQKIERRGVLRVGIAPGVPGLCVRNAAGDYEGLEPDLARAIARQLLGPQGKVKFVELRGDRRIGATRSALQAFDAFRKTISMFATLLGTNWWNLGMAGKLAPFLCPKECVGTLDYVGIDYYWGVSSIWPSRLQRLVSAADCAYGNAPVWPDVLHEILREARAQFPGKPIVVIENGCVTSADNVARSDYITKHILEVQRAVAEGIPVVAYLCWSITSNREWGLQFDNNSDFGLWHIDLDNDPKLTRIPTAASERYAAIIAARSAAATSTPGRLSSPA
ncbi:MAG: family 1 glycosylhydrolase, partial [Candidatus Eremiobacteraeota bacterium]|nr:family 1 glycosylhydrolase [Candidatus Eremiobacteraeota bacterium]